MFGVRRKTRDAHRTEPTVPASRCLTRKKSKSTLDRLYEYLERPKNN